MASAACIAGGILGVVALFVLVIGIPALLKMLIFLNIPGWVVCCLVGVLVWRWSADANFKGHWETTLGRIGVALSSAAFLSQGVLSMIIGPLSLLVAGFAYMIGERRLSIVSIALAAVVLINMPTQSPVIAKHQELFKGQEEPDEENEQTYSAESRLALKKRKKILAQESGSSFDDGLSSSSGDSSLTLDTESVRKYAVANASSPGEQFDINECLVPGKYVIIDFYSEYCGPCRAFAPKLKALADAKDDVVVRKLDINRSGHKGIDWDSPLAEQYEIHSVPYLRIYSPVGLQVAEGKEAKEMVNKWIEESGDEN
jgi:thiol-disulfide isomerase/thioredoxin